jgi:hypothetical protein
MNCDECKDLIDPFMDNELDPSRASAVRAHLAVCDGCARVCAEIASILDLCSSEPVSEIVPPNSKALWCRINNVIENEMRDQQPPPPPPRRRFWHLSLGQLSAAFACIAIVSSLLTVAAIRSYLPPSAPDVTMRAAATQSTFEKILCKVGLMETPQQARDRRLQQQKAAIEYWNERVQARRTQWDRATRDAFDRNLQVIDESVNDYTLILQKDPDDELSGEMLDSVLDDKMNLLRDFSDL